MPLSIAQSNNISNLAKLIYSFLPASGNRNYSFPLAANRIGCADYWQQNSKLPALVNFLTRLLENESNKLVPFLEEVVKPSLVWRKGKEDGPLRREEVEQLNAILKKLGYKSPELSSLDFLADLPSGNATAPQSSNDGEVEDSVRASLLRELLRVSSLSGQERGYAFERFLNELFQAYGLISRGAFKLKGEQIDGSFNLDSQTYLVEAKWENGKTSQADLLILRGKVEGKAEWTRGLFISYSGFSEDGLHAHSQGKSTNMICMDGHDRRCCRKSA